jgi:hypothetical protein
MPNALSDGVVGIGIMWSVTGCDFDLWVKPDQNAKELNYGNTITREGKYFRDFRNHNDKLDFEYVELNAPVNGVRQVKSWINFYSGSTSSAIGIVVVHYQGKTYRSFFSLKASKGNQGKDASQRSKSPYWAEIDVAKIVGQSP